jgi:hypothetical protein
MWLIQSSGVGHDTKQEIDIARIDASARTQRLIERSIDVAFEICPIVGHAQMVKDVVLDNGYSGSNTITIRGTHRRGKMEIELVQRKGSNASTYPSSDKA